MEVDNCEYVIVEVGIQGPAGPSSDMQRATYDTNNNGIVDVAESVPWAGVTGGADAIAATYQLLSFTEANLVGSGLYIAVHGFGKRPSSLILRDNLGQVVEPDFVDDPNVTTTVVSVDNYRPIVGTWTLYLGA